MANFGENKYFEDNISLPNSCTRRKMITKWLCFAYSGLCWVNIIKILQIYKITKCNKKG